MDNGTLLAVKFKDRSVFQMLSSVHSVADVEVGQNHPRTGLQIAKTWDYPWLQQVQGGSWQVWSDGGLFLLQAKHHEMVEESVLPPVFLKHPECFHPVQAKNPVTWLQRTF